MTEKYEIIVDMKTAKGFVEYCRFSLGTEQEIAERIFSSLIGVTPGTTRECYVLRMNFVRHTVFSEVIGKRCCTLNELTCNCQIITKEVFKFLTLE